MDGPDSGLDDPIGSFGDILVLLMLIVVVALVLRTILRNASGRRARTATHRPSVTPWSGAWQAVTARLGRLTPALEMVTRGRWHGRPREQRPG